MAKSLQLPWFDFVHLCVIPRPILPLHTAHSLRAVFIFFNDFGSRFLRSLVTGAFAVLQMRHLSSWLTAELLKVE